MQDMRDCYDTLLSAAAATASSAYEFAESLRDMGSCLLEKTALNDHEEETGKVLLMLGKLQFKLQKLIDNYRSHIIQTITIPSESLLNELRIVEEMKRQCDEKRDVYEYMVTRYRERGRSKGGKGETFSLQQLQTARDEYDEEATLFVFRLKSLKQGQSRSLLTQAARHHAAQLDQVELMLPRGSTAEAAKENLDKLQRNLFSFRMRPSLSRKFSSYVLPTPVDAKSSISSGSNNPKPSKCRQIYMNLQRICGHSSPLEQKKLEKDIGDEFSGPTVRSAQSVLKESNSNTASTKLPPPLVDGLLSLNHDYVSAYSKKIKRHAFSGPLTSNPWPNKPVSVESVQLFSGPLLPTPIPQPPSSSPKVSPSASPTIVSSPKISPLLSRVQKVSAANNLVVSSAASPLPTPPQVMARSFSIPSSGARVAALHGSRTLESSHISSISEDIASPPLTPIALSSSRPSSDG
ncbi:AH/BAR domain superfamily [Sesbania bispinosa]|nr:AH/BAR domain superfamily [Sesbania bispinosa]